MASFCPPTSSANSPFPLYRKATEKSVSYNSSAFMKDLVRFYAKSTLQHKLISAENRKRMSMGKALAHKIGQTVTCVPVEGGVTPVRKVSGAGRGYKSTAPNRRTPNCPSATLLTTSTLSKPHQPSKMSLCREDQSTIISGQGSNLPRVKKIAPVSKAVLTPHRDIVASGKCGTTRPSSSTPAHQDNALTICGITFPGEVLQGIRIATEFEKLEAFIFDQLENGDEEHYEGVITVHESLQKGTALMENQLCWVGEYLGLLRAAVVQSRNIIPREQQTARLRCMTREGGKVERALAEGERIAHENGWAGSTAPPSPPATVLSPQKSKREAVGEDEGVLLESEQPTAKNLRRSTSFSDVNTNENLLAWDEEDLDSELDDGDSSGGEGMQGEAKVEEAVVEDAQEIGEGNAEEEDEIDEVEFSAEDRERLSTYEKSMKAGAVCFDALDSDDGDDGKTQTYAERRWAMMNVMKRESAGSEGEAGKSFVMGPTTPDTNNYLVVGSTPMDDKSSGKAKTMMKNYETAAKKGSKNAKALTTLDQSHIQRNFLPGSYAFSLAVRHTNRSEEKKDPWDSSKTIPFKAVMPTSDFQFRHICWFQFLAKFHARNIMKIPIWERKEGYVSKEAETAERNDAAAAYVETTRPLLLEMIKREMEEDRAQINYALKNYCEM